MQTRITQFITAEDFVLFNADNKKRILKGSEFGFAAQNSPRERYLSYCCDASFGSGSSGNARIECHSHGSLE